jgi:methylmalonyl-CoA mutase cobalamin-binding subunit
MPTDGKSLGTGEEMLFGDEALPAGAALVEEGLAIGGTVGVGRCAFCRSRDVRSEVEWKRSRIAAGEIEWSMIMGLASLDEQIEGLRFLHQFGERTGVVMDRGLVIPNWLTGLPPRLRERAPKSTSFVLGGAEDHVALAEAAPIMPCFNDFHIGSPAAVENTVAAILAGGTYVGVLAQYAWTLPYIESDVEIVAENIKAIGVVAQKWSDEVVVDSYLDDGMPAEFVDYVSTIGYALLERYVVEQLCGARYATGFGGVISDIPQKIAIWLALHEVLHADHPPLSYVYGNTIDAWDTPLAANYGISAFEVAAFAATERRYRTGAALLPNPVTERLRVPTVSEIADIHACARAAAAKSSEFETLIDFTSIEETRDVLVEQGRKFFSNALNGLPAFGVDIRDPLQVLLGIRRLGARRLERLFHPGARMKSLPNGIVPFSQTEFTRRSANLVSRELERIRRRGIAAAVRGRRVIVGSSDTHFFGKFVVAAVLRELGAEVVDAGVDRNPEDLVALLARYEDDTALAVSTHNGQCVGYAERLMEILRQSNRQPAVFIGGRLNSLEGNDSEPRDATDLLRRVGVVPCASVEDLVASLP